MISHNESDPPIHRTQLSLTSRATSTINPPIEATSVDRDQNAVRGSGWKLSQPLESPPFFGGATGRDETQRPEMSGQKEAFMYAVIKTGGKQYRVVKDEIVEIERLPGEAGQTVEFKDILMVGEGASVKVGTPIVAGAKVTGELVELSRGPKVIAFRKRRRKNSRRKKGHRQDLCKVRITSISA
jgi:large subunit ribosomal protein L21